MGEECLNVCLTGDSIAVRLKNDLSLQVTCYRTQVLVVICNLWNIYSSHSYCSGNLAW